MFFSCLLTSSQGFGLATQRQQHPTSLPPSSKMYPSGRRFSLGLCAKARGFLNVWKTCLNDVLNCLLCCEISLELGSALTIWIPRQINCFKSWELGADAIYRTLVLWLLYKAKNKFQTEPFLNTYQTPHRRHWPMDLLCHSYIDRTVRTSGRSRELSVQ